MFSESAEFYDTIYAFKDYASESAQIAALIRSVHPQTRTVLDVGCGTGEHVRFLAIEQGFEVDGLDLDAGLLAVARRKLPAARFFEADMGDFALGRQYDAILCLFSSIGYLVTLERVRRAFECFRRHLGPGGVALVEPWFPPGGLTVGRVTRQTGTYPGGLVERVSRTEVEGRVSRLCFDYRIEAPDGVRLASEIHELGLFTADEMRAAFEAAGLAARFDPVGLTGRGLWIAHSAA